VIIRTGSMGSCVPPAVTTIFFPASGPLVPSSQRASPTISSGSVMRPKPTSPEARCPGRRSNKMNAPFAQYLDTGLGCRMVVHTSVHGGSDQDRAAGSQCSHTQQVVANTIRQARHSIGSGGCNQQQVAHMPQTDMRDMPLAAPQVIVSVSLTSGDRLEGEWSNKMQRTCRQNDINQRASLGQFGSQIGSL
jgi:hypothetical protein